MPDSYSKGERTKFGPFFSMILYKKIIIYYVMDNYFL
jgi:hypothetical protein